MVRRDRQAVETEGKISIESRMSGAEVPAVMNLVRDTPFTVRFISKIPKGAQGETWIAELASAVGSQRIIIKKQIVSEGILVLLQKTIAIERSLRENGSCSERSPFVCFIGAAGTDPLRAQFEHADFFSITSPIPDPHLYLLYEYIDGFDLEDYKRGGGVLTLEIIDQILTAVASLHSMGIVHRDIKPANIMITSGGLIKLIDFGICSTFSDYLEYHGGTPDYLPPEHWAIHPNVLRLYPEITPEYSAYVRSHLTDPTGTDVFAVGATLFYLLEGEHLIPWLLKLFKERQSVSKIVKHMVLEYDENIQGIFDKLIEKYSDKAFFLRLIKGLVAPGTSRMTLETALVFLHTGAKGGNRSTKRCKRYRRKKTVKKYTRRFRKDKGKLSL